jgi:group I intron endonuclease
MWIYKITNIQNQKVYIGQTIRPIEQRYHRHINDAMNNILDTHFARAIRKYGKDNFIIEEIDSAKTQNELNEKDQYWIQYYNSINSGYNETEAINKCGGNTYLSKTEEEMEVIKDKIRQTKIGAKNPMAQKVKRINIQTNEIDIFDTVISCAKACGIKNGKTSISTRLNGQIKSPYKNTWIFEYCDE